MRRPALLFGLLVLAAGIVGAVLLLDPDGEDAAESASAGGAASPGGVSPEDPPTSAPAELVDAGEIADAAAGTQEGSARSVLALDEDRVVVRGQIALPAGVPGDEELRVVALDRQLGVRALGGGGAFAAVWGGEVPTTDEAVEAKTLASVEPEPDGTFELVLPETIARAHLAVSGHYLYSEQTLFVDGSAEGVRLTPLLGARITGTLSAAEDAPALVSPPDDPTRVRLFPDLSSGRFNPMSMGREFTSSSVLLEGDGSFAFRGIPTGLTFGVTARTAPHAHPLELGLTPEPGDHLRVELVADAGGTLRGRVEDAEGSGLAGLEVFALMPGVLQDAVGPLRETESAEDGTYELVGLPAGALQLLARGRGVLSRTESLDPPLGAGEVRADVTLTMDTGARLAGRVQYPGGDPAVDATVSASRDMARMTGPPGMGGATEGNSGSVGGDGRFEITGVRGGPFVLRASLTVAEGERAGTWQAREAGVSLDDGELLLELERQAEVRVRVTADGEPLDTYRLRATLDGSSGMFGLGAESVDASITEAENGVGVLAGLASGEWQLDVIVDGFAQPEPLAFTVPRGPEPLEVALVPCATVLGQVVDTTGSAVSGARVTLALDMQDMFSERVDPPSTVTDGEGAFELNGIEPGAFSLVAEADGFAASSGQALELEPGAVEEDVVLTLSTGGTILGLVLDDEGEPQPGQMIVAQRPPDFARQRMDRTDGAGRFTLENLEPGRWQVTAMRDMLSNGGTPDAESDEEAMASIMEGMKVEFVEVPDGEEVELVLGASVEGAVTVKVLVKSDGEPVKGAMVSFVPEDAGEGLGMNFKLTDADGRAEVEVDRPGGYLVSVQQAMAMGRQSVVEYVETIPEGDEHTLEYELPIGTIRGRVYSPSGDPLPGARVTLTVEGGMTFGSFLGGNYAEVVTDDSGDYEIENLRPGTYSVAAGGSAMGGLFGDTAEGGRVVRGGLRVSEGQELDGVDFRLEEPGTLTGLVRDQAGNPVPGASVFVRDEAGRLLERFSFVATGDDGRFRYTGVQPGTYFASARVAQQASHESAPVRVAAGKEAEVTLRLELATTVLVRVVDRSGEDVQARVRVVDPNGHEVSGMLSMSEILESFGAGFSSEVQRIGPLAPGRYEVEVTTDDGRSAKKPVTVDGRPERKLTIRLR